MKKAKILALCLLLCVIVPMGAMAQRAAECGTPGHTVGDGLDHNRPQSCWVTGHNNCDGLNHERAECGRWRHYNCDGEDHSPAACGAEGHFVCDGKAHEPAACGIAGHCTADGKKHTAAACALEGHFVCDGIRHTAAECGTAGHAVCDGLDHARAACRASGHRACDGLTHEKPVCGVYRHCVSDGQAHDAAPCGYEGHFLCDGKTHEPAACGVEGHYACESRRHQFKPVSKYCNATPQHMTCQGDPRHYCDPAQGGCGDEYLCSHSNAHTPCRMCGQMWCDRSLGGHETPCGNANHRPCVYRMNGKTYDRDDHAWCRYCGGYQCQNGGSHGNGKCCTTCPNCKGPEKMNVPHKACGVHYTCYGTAGHERCGECGHYQCSDEHKALCGAQDA